MYKLLLTTTSVYLIANILAAGIPFLLLPTLTRVLDPSQYGMVAMFLVLIGAMKNIAVTPFIGAINRKYFDRYAKVNYEGFAGSGLLLIFSTIIIMYITMYSMSNFLADYLGIEQLWLYLAIYVSLSHGVIELVLGQFQITRKAAKYAFIQISLSVLNLVISLLFVLYFEWGAIGRVNAIVISYTVVAFFCLYLIFKHRFISLSNIRQNHIIEISKFSLPLMPHMIGGFLLSAFDRLVIAQKLGLDSVGIYFAALQVVMVAKVIFDALNKAYTPWLYENLNKGSNEINVTIVYGTYFWFLLIWIGVGSSFYLAPQITELILGPNFRSASHLLGWMAVSVAFKGMYLVIVNYCFYAKRTGYLSVISIVTGCITIVLILYFIERYGLVGVAYATSIGMGIRFVFVWWLASKCHNMPWFSPFQIQRRKY